jgi:hypothetical protein
MNSVLMTIVFSFPEEVSAQFVALHEQLSRVYEVRFVSQFSVYTPHITIYQAEFPEENKEEVLQRISSIVASAPAITCVPTGVNIRGRYVAVAFDRMTES